MSVPFSSPSVPKNGTKQTARHSRAHKANGTVPCRCAVPFCLAVVPFDRAGKQLTALALAPARAFAHLTEGA